MFLKIFLLSVEDFESFSQIRLLIRFVRLLFHHSKELLTNNNINLSRKPNPPDPSPRNLSSRLR